MMINPQLPKAETIQVLSSPLNGGMALVFGLVLFSAGITFVINPPPNPDPQLKPWIPMLLIVAQSGGLLIATAGCYFMIYRKVQIEISRDGLYVAQHKATIPWDAIARIEYVDLNERKSGAERFADSAINLAAGKRIGNRPLDQIVISFTEAGRRQFGGRDFVGKFTRKHLHVRDDEDMLIRPIGLDWHSRKAVFKNGEELATAARERLESGS